MRPAIILSICLVSFMWPESTHADIAYTVSPLVIDIEAEARDILTRTIIVTNTGDQPITVFPTVNNISTAPGGTIEAFSPPSESDRTSSLASWIEISRLGVDVKQGESRQFPVTFRINPSPVPGTYHTLIAFGVGRNRDEAEAQVKRSEAPGTIINMTIGESNVEFLKLARFVVSRFVTRAGNEAAVYTFRNPGDETVVPKGDIIIYDSTGEEVGAIPVNEERVAIAPGEEHTFVESVPAAGMFGKYKAFLSVEYGEKNRALVQDTSFYYVVPLQALLIIFVVLALLVGGGAWHIHRKYFDDDTIDDSERLHLHVKDSTSSPRDHDVNLKSS